MISHLDEAPEMGWGAAEMKNATRTQPEHAPNTIRTHSEQIRTRPNTARTQPEHRTEQTPNNPEHQGQGGPEQHTPFRGGGVVQPTPPGADVFRACDLTDLDRREITLWRVMGRYDEAQQAGDTEAMARLEAGFRKRLADYEQRCRQEEN